MAVRTVADTLHYSTIKLTSYCDGTEDGCGTGFFVELANREGTCIPAIVTNKHVIKNCDQVIALLHLGDGAPSGESEEFEILLKGRVINHPDADVDLCAILVGDILAKAKSDGEPLFFAAITMESVPADDDWEFFDAMEEVVMVGCPNGIFDEENNLPIARRGITATPINKQYEGRDEFMIDMACFYGSSGSPIFIYNQHGYFDVKANTYRIGERRALLVGVLCTGPEFTHEATVELKKKGRVEINTMMHLGYAIRSSAIREIEKEALKALAPKSIILPQISLGSTFNVFGQFPTLGREP